MNRRVLIWWGQNKGIPGEKKLDKRLEQDGESNECLQGRTEKRNLTGNGKKVWVIQPLKVQEVIKDG